MKSKPDPITETPEFANVVSLLAIYSDAANRLELLQAEANQELITILDDKKTEYAELQDAMTKCEVALQEIALKHPEWFVKRKSIKTPYGTIKLHSSTELDVPNEEATILIIQHEIERLERETESPDAKTREAALLQMQELNIKGLIRQKESLNLDALGNLPDAVLKRFRIARVKKENFSAMPAKLDLGKATASAVEKEAA